MLALEGATYVFCWCCAMAAARTRADERRGARVSEGVRASDS